MDIVEQPGISVIICCYNSASRIENTLVHLSAQQFEKKLPWELILVDNNSNDNTVNIAKSKWNDLNMPAPMKLVTEQKQGLSFARKAGVNASRYAVVIFCDDDNWLNPRYLERASTLIFEKSEIGVLGGWSKAVTNGSFPENFDDIKYSFAVGCPHNESKDITSGWQIWGAGMTSRKHILQTVFNDRFPLLCSDRKGGNLSSGGDDEICCRAIILGFRLYFSLDLFFEHFVSKERLTQEAVGKLQKGFLDSNHVLKGYQFCIRGLWYYQQQNYFKGFESLLKAFLCLVTCRFTYAMRHLETVAFVFRQRWLCNTKSKTIFDFANSNKRFVRL